MLQIIYEDNYILVLNKPPGLRTESGNAGELSLESLVIKYFQTNYPWKKQLMAGTVHRIDKKVGGVLLFAKTPMALKALNRQFEKREVRKTYLAIIEKILPAENGQLKHWLKKNDRERIAVIAHKPVKGYKECSLRYKVLRIKNEEASVLSLVEIELLTGRYHQIRAQLSATGCPILGDEKYGSLLNNESGIIHLHSHRLRVVHPKTNESMEFNAPPPEIGAWGLFQL